MKRRFLVLLAILVAVDFWLLIMAYQIGRTHGAKALLDSIHATHQ